MAKRGKSLQTTAFWEDNNCDKGAFYLPSEIGIGTCTLMLYGSNDKTIATTNYLSLTIDKNILVSDANSTEISESLYNQLVTKVNVLNGRIDNIIPLLEGSTSKVDVDSTLTVAGQAADAKATGDAISQLSDEIANISQTGISAADAISGQVPVADGNGGWAWRTVGGESLVSAEEVSF